METQVHRSFITMLSLHRLGCVGGYILRERETERNRETEREPDQPIQPDSSCCKIWGDFTSLYHPICIQVGKAIKESRAHRAQRGRGHVTVIVLCVPSKIQIRHRQWFVTNYSNGYCLDCTMHTVDFTIFSLDQVRQTSRMPSREKWLSTQSWLRRLGKETSWLT